MTKNKVGKKEKAINEKEREKMKENQKERENREGERVRD